MSEGFYRPGDRLPDKQPDFIGDDGKRMYGGWFADPEPINVVVEPDATPLNNLSVGSVHEIVRSSVAHELMMRTIPDYPAYFVNRHWLVTYEWVMQEKRELETRIAALEVAQPASKPLFVGIVIGNLIAASIFALVVLTWLR